MSEPDANSNLGNGRGSALRRFRWPLIVAGPLIVIVVVIYFVLTGGRTQSTDDAYVQIDKVPVAPSIGGRVVEIYVKENQLVHKGDVLFRLDPRDFVANANAAAAQVADAELRVNAAKAAYQEAEANVSAAQDTVTFATREAVRERNLAAAGVASRDQVDQALHAEAQARQNLAASRQAAAQALAQLGGNPNMAPSAHPAVLSAEAQLERARLNVSYTTVVAPSDGIVTRVDQLPVGAYLNASQTAFWLLSGKPWVEANFKEDQLAKMKVGQPAQIKIDAYPGVLRGHVGSFSPGTGSAFSVLPAQNATGNWVKVVQRLPVRIDFDEAPTGAARAAGLSANVKVDVTGAGKRAG